MRIKPFLLAASMCVTAPAMAFDDSRQGFMIGVGVGLHSTDLDFYYYGDHLVSDSRSGIATSFKIGGGLTDQFALYFTRNVSWYNAPFYDGYTEDTATFALGITGIGASYFLSPTAPSVYFTGAAGLGDLVTPFESRSESDHGSAFMFGAGYEFDNHVTLEAVVLKTDIDSEDDSNLTLETSSFQVMVNYLFY